MLTKVISGGQTGADQAGLRAAHVFGIKTGGWAARGWLTERGTCRALNTLYGLLECPVAGYPARTRKNVLDSDGTLVFEALASSGSTLTVNTCVRENKPYHVVKMKLTASFVYVSPSEWTAEQIAEWIVAQNIRVLNIAGNRESKAPGIEQEVSAYLRLVFAELSQRQE